MPEGPNSSTTAADLVKEQVDLSLVDRARTEVVIRDPWQDSRGGVEDQNRGLMSKLGEKFIDYLRRLAG